MLRTPLGRDTTLGILNQHSIVSARARCPISESYE